MKKYNITTRKRREADNKIVRFKDEMDVLISSEEFIETFRAYIEDIAMYKSAKGIKYRRSTEYAAIGILDQNDLFQEAYLAFLEAYDMFKSKSDNFETGAEVWSYLKKSTTLNFESQIRGKKDGIRLTHHAQFVSKTHEVNLLTSLFGHLERVFSNNVMDVEVTKYDTDLTGYFLEVHMDNYLDLKKSGGRNYKGIERMIIKDFYGIDCIKRSSKEIAKSLDLSVSTVDVVRKRALDKLKGLKSKVEIANFLHEYRIETKSDIDKFKK